VSGVDRLLEGRLCARHIFLLRQLQPSLALHASVLSDTGGVVRTAGPTWPKYIPEQPVVLRLSMDVSGIEIRQNYAYG